MTRREAFLSRDLNEIAVSRAHFSGRELEQLDTKARPHPSMAARQLAKQLVLELLGASAQDARQVEILGSTPVAGPPTVYYKKKPAACRLHVSLSHSKSRVAAYVLMERPEITGD